VSVANPSFRVVYTADARRGLSSLSPDQRRAVLAAERGDLSLRPFAAGEEYLGHAPGSLRRLVLAQARVSIGHRVYADKVEVEVVWLIGHP
jgi:hypothetical protein